MPLITSEEVNYLIYRYLLESGFTHSTFTFHHESALNKSSLSDISHVKPGALISLLQKGLKYMEVEKHIGEDGTERRCIASFSLLKPHECEFVDVDDLEPDYEADDTDYQQSLKDRERERLHPNGNNNNNNNRPAKKPRREDGQHHSSEETHDHHEHQHHPQHHQQHQQQQQHQSQSSASQFTGKKKDKDRRKLSPSEHEDAVVDVEMNDASPTGAIPASVSVNNKYADIEIPSDDVVVLEGHTAEVFTCAWNPSSSNPMIASGAGDGTAKIWKLANAADKKKMTSDVVTLEHGSDVGNKDVTTLEWSPDGKLLATGSYDGVARMWTASGELKFTMRKHKGPIFSLKWDPSGELLLSGSVDKTAIVWDAKTGEIRQQFEFHEAPTLDVDWKDNITFATCSTDKQIYVCQLGSPEPLRQYSGHTDEVNAVKWSPCKTYLASCSDDKTAKIWSWEEDGGLDGESKPFRNFVAHDREIYTLSWAPASSSDTESSSSDSILSRKLVATASFDSTVRLWDVLSGDCVWVFTAHTEPVYSLGFSPNGKYLATGSFDEILYVYNIESVEEAKKALADGESGEGKVVPLKRYKGVGGIFELVWNGKGNRIAACFSEKNVVVLNVDL